MRTTKGSGQKTELNYPNISKEFDDFLDNNRTINKDDVPTVEETNLADKYFQTIKKDHDAINKLMLQILSPQLSENEIQKRSFKEKLMKYILKVLFIQLILIGIFVIGIFSVLCFGYQNEFLTNNINQIFSFLRYYMTAIIAELIAMLFFIVKFVFDKSIVDLLSDTIKKN